MIDKIKSEGRSTLRFWCAAASTGEEVYSLAMFLKYHIELLDSKIDFEIIGSDICEPSVKKAQNGVYLWKQMNKIPQMYKEGNCLRGRGDISRFGKVADSIRKHCKFKVVNLVTDDFTTEIGPVDHIFCRNVFIYFDTDIIQRVVSKFEKVLKKDSFLFIGISENLNEIKGNYKYLGNSVYDLTLRK